MRNSIQPRRCWSQREVHIYLWRKHDRIAQVIIEKIEPTEVVEVNELSETLRGEGGFGSTGILSENQAEMNSVNSKWCCEDFVFTWYGDRW